jgi:2-dehydropantoate 2-reductase
VKILVFGPGVIGTLYAARLQESGQLVTVLARGERLAEIRRHGLTLEDVVSGRRSTVSALGEDRLLLGFPGAGGTSDGHIVRYALISQQPTTLGELNGRSSERVRSLAGAFKAAGFSTTISGDMDGWLKAHAFFVTAVSGAIYMVGGNCRRLSEDSASLTLMTKGVREGFAAVRSLGRTVTPFPLMVLFTWLPQSFAVSYWRRFFATDMADYVFGPHARSASREMREIASDCLTLLEKTGVEAPALHQLYQAIDAYAVQG